MSNQKKYLPLLLGIAIAVGIYLGGSLNFTDKSDKLFSSNSKKDKLNRLIDYIDFEYVDEVNTDSIVDVTVNGILENLDPHSIYIPKEDLQRITDNMKGDFVGIGINFYPYNDTITVIKTVKNGPSYKAGILAGDRIIEANGDSIYGPDWDNEKIINKLKGPLDSKVHLKIIRKGKEKPIEISLRRDHVPLISVDAAYMLTDNLGYIKINRFAESTYKEFKKALDNLQDQGATKLALDLRENPGGFIGIAEQIVDEFLEDDKLILFTKNKRDKIEKSFATKKGDFEEGDIYVLINENSASASEIVAGALQDHDKGTIVGRRSYGKGLVQREMALGDGSAIRLTVSRYYTPTGRSIQRDYSSGNSDYFDDYLKRLESGELLNPENIEVADSLKYTTPKGKIVFGGGGIIPDVFVPIDGAAQNETLNFLLRRGYMDFFIFEELDKDRSPYVNITKNDFVADFEITDSVVAKFRNYLEKRFRVEVSFVAYKDQVKQYLKATLAEQLYDKNTYEQLVNQHDLMIDEVVRLSSE